MSKFFMKTQHVTLDMRPLGRLTQGLKQRPRHGSPMDTMYRQWGKFYLTSIRKRYKQASQSPGNPWADLADSTKKGRRKSSAEQRRTKKAKTKTGRTRRRTKNKISIGQRKFSILINLGILYNALSIGSKGNLFRVVEDGIEVGFNDDSHGGDNKTATIAEIAAYHHTGGSGKSKLPKRKILVNPRTHVKRQMIGALDIAVRRLLGGR